jgi:hypothetical protein
MPKVQSNRGVRHEIMNHTPKSWILFLKEGNSFDTRAQAELEVCFRTALFFQPGI